MLTILGSLLGFAGSTIPSIVDHFKAKEENKLTLEVLRMQGELAKEKADIDLIKFRAMAQDNEHQRLINHDIALANSKGPLSWLRTSVRPVITYLFFALFATVKVASMNVALEEARGADGVLDAKEFNIAMEQVWDDETAGIFAAIISFWFGRRALEKKGS